MRTTNEGAEAEMRPARKEAEQPCGKESSHAQREPPLRSASEPHQQHTRSYDEPLTSTSHALQEERRLIAAGSVPSHHAEAMEAVQPRPPHSLGRGHPATTTTMPVKPEPSSDAAFALARFSPLSGSATSTQGSSAGASSTSASATPRLDSEDAARAARRQSVNETSTRLRKKHEQTKQPIVYRLIASAKAAQTSSTASSCRRERPGSVEAGENMTHTLQNADVDLPTSAHALNAPVIGQETDATLIVKSKGEVLLQRLSPPNYKKSLKFGQHVRKGKELLAVVADDEDREGHKGIIDCGLDGLGWTSGQAEDAILEWSWRLFHQHVHPLATLLEPELRSKLDARRPHHDTFGRLLGAGQCTFTHPWWTKVTIARGFPGVNEAHASGPKQLPIVLVACEEAFVLCAELADGNGFFKVVIKPGQVVFVATPYQVLPIGGQSGTQGQGCSDTGGQGSSAARQDRWAVAFTFPSNICGSGEGSSTTTLRRRLNPLPLQPNAEEQRRYKTYPRLARPPKETKASS